MILQEKFKHLFQCQFVHHKSHMNRPGIEPQPFYVRPTTNLFDKAGVLIRQHTN